MENKKILGFIVSIIFCEFIGIIGSFFTFSSIPTWYAALNKPFFSPPNFVFAPVWTSLYALIGISLYLLWEKREEIGTKLVLVLFGIQLFLNGIWSILFFGLRSPFFGLINIILLWFFLIVTIIKSYKISKKASLLLIPYLIWVSFASLLNLAIFLLN